MQLTIKLTQSLLLYVMLVFQFALGAPRSFADETLIWHSAGYSVQISIVKGSMDTTLRQVPSGLMATSYVRPRGWARIFKKGSISGESEFLIAENGVRPIQYDQSDTISKKSGLITLRFDWENNSVSGVTAERKNRKIEEQQVKEDLTLGTYDPISLQYALMYDLMTDSLKEQYALLDGGELKFIQIQRMSAAQITVPHGEYEVIPVMHQAESSSRKTIFWFAPALNYLPVRIEQFRGEKRQMVAELTRYQLLPAE